MFNDPKTAAGNVYVFNVFSQDLTLATNGLSVAGGIIPAWTMSGTDKYQPNVQPVPRKLNASDGPGNFFNGTNALSINWLDGLFIASVPINGAAFPMNEDILLFIERNKWQLVSQFGVFISSGDVLAAGTLREALGYELAAKD